MLLLIFTISFVFIFCKAYQQRNVIHNNWLLVPIFSYLMAFLEVLCVGIISYDVINNGFSRIFYLALAQGTGGFLGCWCAMYLHNRYNLTK